VIIGIGVDIVQIARIREVHERQGDTFISRVFSKAEAAFCMQRKDPYPCLAARFAAKEAFIKALPGPAPALSDICVISGEDGQPSIDSGGTIKDILASAGASRIHLSLSHERDNAVAFVVIES